MWFLGYKFFLNFEVDVLVNDPMTSEEILREHQLQNLRKICIPKITLLLYTVMSEMNEHAECIKLADTLASEQYQLYKVIIIFLNKYILFFI